MNNSESSTPANTNDQLSRILKVRDQNFFILGKFSRYLNGYEDFISKDMVDEVVNECGVDQACAFRLLFTAACGLFPEDDENDRELYERYLDPSLRLMDQQQCQADPYYRNIHLPQVSCANWEFRTETWQPYQAFVRDDIVVDTQLHEVPRLGYFSQPFSFPAVLENGREWMSVTPSEINTIRPAVEAAQGEVMTFGLGLGYYPLLVSEKPSVRRILVVEKDEAVIELFSRHILPQFPHREKVQIVHMDAFEYAEKVLPGEHFNLAFADTWHDAADGVEHYLLMNKLEKLSPQTSFLYWVEETLLSYLRWYYFDLLGQSGCKGDPLSLLQSQSVKQMARELPLAAYQKWRDQE